MAKPLSHRERAERALSEVDGCGSYPLDQVEVKIIARETFPAELVEAARALLEDADPWECGIGHSVEEWKTDPESEDYCSECAARWNASKALALYEKEPGHE